MEMGSGIVQRSECPSDLLLSATAGVLIKWLTLSEMAELRQKVEVYENLLVQLKGQVDSACQLAITKALAGVCTEQKLSVILIPLHFNRLCCCTIVLRTVTPLCLLFLCSSV